MAYEGDPSIIAYGDEDRIAQVLTNFINNAVKYAPSSKAIKIRVEQVDNAVKVVVTDEGPGIPKEKHAHLFDRYYRVDSSGAQVSGLGLGLYISAEIIKKHEGRIDVESYPGQGASFWFSLPSRSN